MHPLNGNRSYELPGTFFYPFETTSLVAVCNLSFVLTNLFSFPHFLLKKNGSNKAGKDFRHFLKSFLIDFYGV